MTNKHRHSWYIMRYDAPAIAGMFVIFRRSPSSAASHAGDILRGRLLRQRQYAIDSLTLIIISAEIESSLA